MPWDQLQPCSPGILEYTKLLYNQVLVWYNSELNKLKMEFVEPAEISMPDLLIGFEPGRPAYDMQVKPHRI